MEPRITFVTLAVTDPARSLAFYRDGLGLPVEGEPGVLTVFLMAGLRLALFPRDALAEDAGVPAGGEGFGGVTLSHNVRRRDEVDALLERAAAAGARVTRPARETFWGGYAGWFADPDGHLWEVAWNPKLELP